MTGAGGSSGGGAAGAIPRLATIPTQYVNLAFRVATVVAAQLFDFATFTLMIGRQGIAGEMNPLVAQGFAYFGLPILALMKAALVVLLGSIIIVLDRNRTGRSIFLGATIVTILAVVGGLVGGISNVRASLVM